MTHFVSTNQRIAFDLTNTFNTLLTISVLISMQTLSAAQYICNQIPDCGGVTLLSEEFELRGAGYPIKSLISEESWVKGKAEGSWVDGLFVPTEHSTVRYEIPEQPVPMKKVKIKDLMNLKEFHKQKELRAEEANEKVENAITSLHQKMDGIGLDWKKYSDLKLPIPLNAARSLQDEKNCPPRNTIINEETLLRDHPELMDMRTCKKGVAVYDRGTYDHINRLLQDGG